MSLRNLLREQLRESLNRAQSWVMDFDSQGGFDAFIADFRARVITERERLLSGQHPLDPEYFTKVRLWHARLEVEPGATPDEIRRSFRTLMRRYHPDLYAGNAEHEALATRLTQELTVAYEGLLAHLGHS